MSFGSYPHLETVLHNLTDREFEVMGNVAKKFRDEHAAQLQEVFNEDPILQDAFNLLMDVREGHALPDYEISVPDRNDLPTRSSFDGELTFDDAFHRRRPQIDLAQMIKGSFPVRKIQLYLEGNSVLAEAIEQYNESQGFSDLMYSSDELDSLIEEVDALDFETLHKQTDGITSGQMMDFKTKRDFDFQHDVRTHSDSIRKRSKQKAKRR